MALFLALLLFAAAAAHADLKWDATRLEFHPAISEREVTGQFPFTNTGPGPVSIDAVEPGCGCTTATLAKLSYQPGERGRVEATFHIGERTGFQEKVIRVWVHGEGEPVVLTLATYIPELVKIEPRCVFWRLGDPPQPRLIKVTALPGAGLTGVHLFSPSPRFKAVLGPAGNGGVYMLVVTPTGTTQDVSAIFDIEALAGAGVRKKYEVFANIIPR